MTMPQQVTYQVTAVTPYTDTDPAGNITPGKRVSVTTSSGYEGTVFVPQALMGSPGAVQALIEGELGQVAAVQAIRGTLPAG